MSTWYGTEYPELGSEIAASVRSAIARGQMLKSYSEMIPSGMLGGAESSIPLGFSYGALMSAVGGLTDLAKMAAQLTLLERMKNEFIPNAPNLPLSFAYKAKDLDLAVLPAEVLKKLGTDYSYLDYAWQTGITTGLGPTFASFQEQFMNSGQLLYAYSALQYQTSVLPRMRRYWMKEFTPSVPNTSMAHHLLHRGVITDAQFQIYAGYDGWDKSSIDLLKSVWKALPNEQSAFRMYMRGALDGKTKNAMYFANSWEEEWFSKLDMINQELPSARDAFRLFRRGKIKEDVQTFLMQASGFMPTYQKLLPSLYERLPMPRDAFHMMMRGAIKQDDFEGYVEKNEWETGSAERLTAIYQHLPDARHAFTLFKRGVLKETDMQLLMKANNFMPVWTKVLPRLFEHIPTSREAYTSYMRGKIDKKAFDKWVESNEWQSGMSDFLYNIYTRLPSESMAFYMWCKGIIDSTQRDQLYKAAGFDEAWHDKLTENNYHVLSAYDVTRIADFVVLDNIWATKVLKERGYRDRDIAKILQMLKIRPLRTDITRQIAIWVKRYKMGWTNPTDLATALQGYVDGGWIQPLEKDFYTTEAELNYEDELETEKIDIYSWYYKTAIISEDELLQDFLVLGIREEKANLMVEDLKAQGYYGYY